MASVVTTDENVEECIYKRGFELINQLSRWKRLAENEQAIGRTRFLYHDVTFYAVTKDRFVSEEYNFFKDPEKVRVTFDGEGIELFDAKSSSFYFFVKKALDKIVSPSNARDGIVEFKNPDVLKEVKSLLHRFLPHRKSPATKTVGDHISDYLEKYYRRSKIGRHGEYAVRLSDKIQL